MQVGGDTDILLRVSNLSKSYRVRKGLVRRRRRGIRAVDGVSFFLHHGETYALVGENGAGKTTIGRIVLRLSTPSAGVVLYDSSDGRAPVSLLDADATAMRRIRREIRLLLPDPSSSLNPRLSIREIIADPLRVHRLAQSPEEIEERVAEVLTAVDLTPSCMDWFPHALSAGDRQRVCIARALVLKPKLVLADEPVAALDTAVQFELLQLMQKLREEWGLTYLVSTRDVSAVEWFSDRVGVLYCGRLVEQGRTDVLFRQPRHPYTAALLAAAPNCTPDARRRTRLPKRTGIDREKPPAGCLFHPQCSYAKAICRRVPPPFRNVSGKDMPAHHCACHRSDELNLEGTR